MKRVVNTALVVLLMVIVALIARPSHESKVRKALGREPSSATEVFNYRGPSAVTPATALRASNLTKAHAVEAFEAKEGTVLLVSRFHGYEGGYIDRYLLIDCGKAWLVDDDRRSGPAPSDRVQLAVRVKEITSMTLGSIENGDRRTFEPINDVTRTSGRVIVRVELSGPTGGAGYF